MVPVPFKGWANAGVDEASALKVAAIYGANASGKTNVLRALEFMKKAVVESHSSWRPDEDVPRQPFAGSDHSMPSRFLMDFEFEGTRYQYGFAVTSAAVEEEWLYAFPKGRRQAWYSRQPGNQFTFGNRLKGGNEAIRALTRQNSLFLSAAAQNNHEQLSPIYRWFSGYIFVLTGDSVQRARFSPRFSGEPASLETLRKYLGKADLGVVDVEIRNPQGPLGSPVTFERMLEAFPSLRLLHRIGDKAIPFERGQESDGTLAYLDLLRPITEILASGGLLCVDELDASLHPLLVAEIVRLFRESSNAAKPAQLLFTAHNTNLLGVLARDQIWFVEKDNNGVSQLYPLSDFKPRRQENLELGYMQGRYGAIPLLNNSGIDGTL